MKKKKKEYLFIINTFFLLRLKMPTRKKNICGYPLFKEVDKNQDYRRKNKILMEFKKF